MLEVLDMIFRGWLDRSFWDAQVLCCVLLLFEVDGL